MIGIDTNVLLRWLNGGAIASDSQAQMAQVEVLMADDDAHFFVNFVVLAECIWVLRHKLKLARTDIAAIVGQLMEASNLTVQDAPIVRAALASFLHFPGDFADHLIGEINRVHGCATTMTFDKAAARSPLFSPLPEVI